jgi:hypothetical protein
VLRLDEQPNSKNRSFSTAKKVQGTFRSLAWALSYGVFVFEISGLDVRKSFGRTMCASPRSAQKEPSA